jgi:glycosyltransferase involved in cell wall biosynthesis
VYAIELVRAMAARDRRDGYALYTRGNWLDADLADKRNWRVEHIAAASRPLRLAWEQMRLPRALAALGIDVLHSTHHTLPLARVGCRRVVTIHDVTFFRIPARYPPARRLYMQTLTRLSARVADAIIAPSNAARDDIVRTLGVPAARVETVYEAAADRFGPVANDVASQIARRRGLDGRFVLSVGSLEPGKNRARLIRAMAMLRDAGMEHHLVVVGQKAWKYDEELALVDTLRMGDRVHYLGYVSDVDLPALYSAADAFAFPSLHEGFGLPVIEAMACGVPVLTSNISATAEVAGDAGLLVDPLSVEAIRDGLQQLVQDSELRRKLSARGLARAAEFSWRRAADETHDLYARVAAGKRAT